MYPLLIENQSECQPDAATCILGFFHMSIRSKTLALLSLLPVVAGLAQTGSVPADTFSCDTDDQVLNAPYSARHRITSVERRADGSVKKEEASESVARDSQGRRYRAGESHWTYLDAGKPVVKSEMLYQIVDPVARTDTKWDTTSRQVKVIHWSESASTAGAADPRCQLSTRS